MIKIEITKKAKEIRKGEIAQHPYPLVNYYRGTTFKI